jgi:NifU-like protein involved in Fe-S cluster formation
MCNIVAINIVVKFDVKGCVLAIIASLVTFELCEGNNTPNNIFK